MVDTLLATTSVDGLTPLGTPAQRSFELISGAIRDQLGDRHADIFAEPVANQYGDRLDWYAPVEGKRRKLTDLDGDERAKADALLEELISDISERARALLEDDDPEKQRLGEALANSVRFPGPESVFVVGEGVALSPVLVNWAWVADDRPQVLVS